MEERKARLGGITDRANSIGKRSASNIHNKKHTNQPKNNCDLGEDAESMPPDASQHRQARCPNLPAGHHWPPATQARIGPVQRGQGVGQSRRSSLWLFEPVVLVWSRFVRTGVCALAFLQVCESPSLLVCASVCVFASLRLCLHVSWVCSCVCASVPPYLCVST